MQRKDVARANRTKMSAGTAWGEQTWAFASAVAHPGAAHRDRTDAGHDLAPRQMEAKEVVACWNLAKSAERDEPGTVTPTVLNIARRPNQKPD
jgi:hypothetical protein